MGGPSENPGEIPKINFADYVTAMELIDRCFDIHEPRKKYPLDAEFYGELEGWEDNTHKFIHDLVNARVGVKLYTRACIDENSGEKKFLNSPDQVEFYSMYLIFLKEHECLYINTTDPDLVRENHKSFFEVVIQHENALEAVDWLLRESRYGKMRSPQYSGAPLIDIMPMSARKKAAQG